ncbi:MAG: hypothetical protein Q7R75_01625 [bacterium]|nr:hypothetical protein [bacterium]
MKSKKKKIIVICARDFASDELQNKNTSDLFIPADPLKNLLEYIPENKSTPGLRREA